MVSVIHVLPPVLGYFVMAILAVTPHTHTLRVSLGPVILFLSLCAAASVDMSLTDPDQRFNNTMFTSTMILIATRILDWTLAKEALVRHLRPVKEPKSTLMDALDLAFTLRGHGWNWSRGLHVPRETRPMDPRGFTFHVMVSAAIHALLYNIVHTTNRSFPLTDVGAAGGSIFDDTLPFHLRYMRAAIISATTAATIYAFIQLSYDVCTLVAVLFLGHAPEQWPPAFDAPWRATSVSEFWARRWHQFFRRHFIFQGGLPLAYMFGRAGFVVGAFLSSGLFHHIGVAILDGEFGAWRLLVGFGAFVPAVLAEHAFKQATGRRVGGLAGWVWTLAWLLVGGNLITDGFARAGCLERMSLFEGPMTKGGALALSVARFDAWLHSAAR